MRRFPRGHTWYQRLLRLYPTDFRDEFGGEMTQLYRDRAREERFSSLWYGLFVDVVKTAPAQHLDILRHDLRDAWRSFRRTPAITAAAILSRALGTAVAIITFNVLLTVLWRPLPYQQPDQLVELFEANLTTGSTMRASALNYLSWAERSQSFQAIGAFGSTGFTLSGDGDPELLNGSAMTSSTFRVLSVAPLAGRVLQPEDDEPGSARVVALSESLWRRRFGGDRAILGRSIVLDGQPYQVVGIMPRTFREVGRSQVGATSAAQLFVPMQIDRGNERRDNHTLRVIGRLRGDVTLEQGRDELRRLAAAMEQEFPATNKGWTARFNPVSDTMLDPQVRGSLLLLGAAVAMVFLIVCANVANLLLARTIDRQGQLAVRVALGARRTRLVRQLITECVCLAAVGGAVGVCATAIAQPLVRTILPATLPRLDEMRVDLNVLAFAVLVTMTSALAFGIAPAARASRLDPMRSLTASGRASMSASRVRVRQLLIVGQMALATMLLVGAALVLQGLIRLQGVPLGFNPDRVLTSRVSLPRAGYPDAMKTGQFYEQLLMTLEQQGDVERVAVASSAPFAPGVRAAFRPPDPTQTRAADISAAEHIVSDDYFRVLAVPVMAGRSFNEHDTSGSVSVAIVSQAFANLWWPSADPIGQTMERSGKVYQVVGVVGDLRGSDTQGLRGGGPDREPRAAVYFSARQMPQRTMTLLVRARTEAGNVTSGVRAAIRQLDSMLALQQVRPLREWFDDSIAPTRLTMALTAAFAVCALLLASIGIYGVLAFTVVSRTREIGLRMAVGATRSRVIRLVLSDGMTWAGVGVVLGLLGALSGATLAATLVFGVNPRDPVTFALVGTVVMLVAALACSIPAARAVRVDPTIAMRTE